MAARDGCLERAEIRSFLQGDGPDGQAEAIADHLERCAVCGEIATEVVGQSDTIVRLARGLDEQLESEPACRELRRRLLDSSPTLLARLTLPLALGQYDLIEPLGQGGMGRVFKARQRLLKRTVAVKLLSPDRADDPEAVASFLREMEALGSLDHRHIVRAADAACIDGVYFLVMDYDPGLDLSRLLERLRQLACADACEIVRQAAVGLQYAHENGLVHCDIKPSNLLLTDQGVVKVLDLGLARFQQRESQNSILTVAGTIDYMAPEQWSPRLAVDIRADIYALGCTLFKLLTGRAPYESAGTARRAAHESAPIPGIAALRSDLPPPLEAVIRRMLCKRPEDRFSQPSDVAEALAPFSAGSDLAGLMKRVASPSEDTVRLRSVAETIIGRERLKRLGAKRLRLILAGVGLGLIALVCVFERAPAWPLKHAHSGAARIATYSATAPPRFEPVESNAPALLPTPLIWPTKPTSSFWNFDAATHELSVSCTETALFQIGRTAANSYDIQATIEQIHWERVGLFFGFHHDEPQGPSQFQLVELADDAGGKFTFRRRLLRRSAVGGFQSEELGFAAVPSKPGPHILNVSVRSGRLGSVRWDGQPLDGLGAPEGNKPAAPRLYIGAFGTYNDRSTGQFQNMTFLSEESASAN